MGRSRSVFLIAIKFTTTLRHLDAEADQVCDRVVQKLTQRSPADSYNRLSIAEIFVP